MKFIKKFLIAAVSLLVLVGSSFCVSAAEIRPYGENGKIISVSHGGNWGEYPIFSERAIESAFEIGADCVSVSVKKTSDGQFVLCEDNDLGKLYAPYKGQLVSALTLAQLKELRITDSLGALSDNTLCDLADAIDAAKRFDKTLIIDGGWEYRKELYSYFVEKDALSSVILRTDASKSEIKEFISLSGGMCRIAGYYQGNIIFSARSYVTTLSKSGCGIVMLGTKNPFGVIYNKSMLSAFAENNYFTRAMAATYDPDLCGQRTDTESAWNDLIDRGYSVIETNDIAALVNYIGRISNLRNELIALTARVEKLDVNNCSEKSAKEISGARAEASEALTTLSSYETLAKAKHILTLALNDLSVSNEDHTRKGVLKISAGKITAVVLVTAALAAGQVYTYKMQKKKRSANEPS
ncbi:MAG: glycerophosphodiester phosphodiesterase family protein [Oscillospiraceae bacterium]|nr:glycerophosphodiester phosphodiesterase family protein [Oscillospiraceae bacterium]